MRVVLLLYSMLLSASLHAQLPQYHARIFDAKNGLTATPVHQVFKDRRDFLWIIYPGLAEKFDGRVVQKFQFNETLVHALNDRSDNTWVISTNTVYRIGGKANSFEKVNARFTQGTILLRIFQLPATPVCLLTSKGFYEWDEKGGEFRFSSDPGHAFTRRTAVSYFDTCGNSIFIPAGDKLFAYDYANKRMDSITVTSLYGVYALTPTLAVYTNFKGYSYWCDFRQGKTVLIDPKKYFPGQFIDHFRINGLIRTGDQRFLALTSVGLMQYDLAKDAFTYAGSYEDGKPFEFENTMSGLFSDNNGMAWAHAETLITSFSPVTSVMGLIRNNETDPSKKRHNVTTAFARGKNDDLWMATGRGFARLNTKNGNTEVFHPVEDATDQLSHESIRGILFDGKNVIIAPTDKGIWLYNPGTKKYQRPVYDNDSVKNRSEHDYYDMIATLKNGDHIFPGRDALYIMDGKSYRMRFLSLPGRNLNYNTVLQDDHGTIWIGTANGLYCFDENYNYVSKLTDGLNAIVCLYQVKDGVLFAGTLKGLQRINISTKTVTNETTPFGNTAVTSIFSDSLDRYWFVTQAGVFLSDRELSAFRSFDYADNIQSNYFYGNAHIRTADGITFLGGMHGINYFKPEYFSLEDKPLAVFLRMAVVNSIDSFTAEQFPGSQFGYNQKRVSFELSTPFFNNSSKLRYRYKLKSGNEWIDNGNSNLINFSSLAPGKYELAVAVSSNGKHWYEGAETYSFSISPPFWKKTWFIALFIATFLSLMILWQRRRERLIRAKQEQQLQQEQLKAENLAYKLEANRAQLVILENERKAATAKLQSMRLQMNPHFLFNSLNSIQQMIMTGKQEKATLYLSKFSKLLRMVLTHSDREIVSLREETEMLRLYIELESLRFEDVFLFSITVDPDVDPEDTKIPTLLIQPFVENAIWHGLLHKEGLRKLDVKFSTNNNDELLCVVEDNGIGREAAKVFAKRASQSGEHTGKGTTVATERLKIFNEQNGDNSQLEIADLVDRSGKAAGTKVTITLPDVA